MTESAAVDPPVQSLHQAWVSHQLLRGLAHDLRNHLQVLALGLSGSDAGMSPTLGPRLEMAIDGMAASLDVLSTFGRPASNGDRPSDLATVLEELPALADLQRTLPTRMVTIVGDLAAPCLIGLTRAEALELFLSVVAMAKALGAESTGPIPIVAHRDGGTIAVAISQPGVGPWLASGDRGAIGPLAADLIAAVACQALVTRAAGRWSVTPNGGLDLRFPATGRG